MVPKRGVPSQGRHESLARGGTFPARIVVTVLTARTEGGAAFLYHSERPNTRAAHIQCCPRQPRVFLRAWFLACDSARGGCLRLRPAKRVRAATASGSIRLVSPRFWARPMVAGGVADAGAGQHQPGVRTLPPGRVTNQPKVMASGETVVYTGCWSRKQENLSEEKWIGNRCLGKRWRS